MICEATIDGIVELLKLTYSELNCWQEWLVFSDIFFFLMKSGCMDFVDCVDKLGSRFTESDHHILNTNHVTWLLAQIIRVEHVMAALNNESRKIVPSISMVETYTRLLLIAPHSSFHSHFSHLAQRNASLLSKPGVTLLALEIVNYHLLPLYRYQGKCKTLMYDVAKIISALKGKRGDHRVFRLAENLCINLILSLRDFFSVKREGKGPTEFTETLNRITIITLAITIKTRGIANADHLLGLQTMLDQILATSKHIWSEKTLHYFTSLLHDVLMGRANKRGLAIQAWQQSETTVINQCTQLLSSSADSNYVMTYISHSFPQHRQYLCAGAWILRQGHPENINS